MFLQSFAKNLCISKSDKNRGRVGKNITTTTTENEKNMYADKCINRELCFKSIALGEIIVMGSNHGRISSLTLTHSNIVIIRYSKLSAFRTK